MAKNKNPRAAQPNDQLPTNTEQPAETGSTIPEMIGAARNRVKELMYVPADKLNRHPLNYRQHPDAQKSTLRGMMNEVGFSTALIAYRNKDGDLQLIDGHLRAETAGSELVPVLLLDVTDEEANKLLLTMDPLAQLAETDDRLLKNLLEDTTASLAAGKFIADLHHAAGVIEKLEREKPEAKIKHEFIVHVTLEDEQSQVELFEELCGNGYKCRLLSL